MTDEKIEVQELLFDEDRARQTIEKNQSEIRFAASVVGDKLKASEGYMKLLVGGPKTVADIYFRCQQGELAKDTLRLLSQQATELSRVLSEAADQLGVINDLEEEANRLTVQCDAEPHGVESEELGFDPLEGERYEEDGASTEEEHDELPASVDIEEEFERPLSNGVTPSVLDDI